MPLLSLLLCRLLDLAVVAQKVVRLAHQLRIREAFGFDGVESRVGET